MININNRNYNLCLLDSNALSNLLSNPTNWFKYIESAFGLNTIIGYSIFTLAELRKRPELFSLYIDTFSKANFPSVILDGHESISIKEIDKYDVIDNINPIVLAPFAINDPILSNRDALYKVLNSTIFIDRSQYWKENENDILTGIIELKNNYPPKCDKYTMEEIENFVEIVSLEQIAFRYSDFARSVIKSGSIINIENFPSIVTTAYVIFYKFYPDDRKPKNSDIFDIIISSILPYVDFFITERNFAYSAENGQSFRE